MSRPVVSGDGAPIAAVGSGLGERSQRPSLRMPAFKRSSRDSAPLGRTSLFEKEPQMDDIIANLGLYALAAFAVGFVFAWIACARVEQ